MLIPMMKCWRGPTVLLPSNLDDLPGRSSLRFMKPLIHLNVTEISAVFRLPAAAHRSPRPRRTLDLLPVVFVFLRLLSLSLCLPLFPCPWPPAFNGPCSPRKQITILARPLYPFDPPIILCTECWDTQNHHAPTSASHYNILGNRLYAISR